MSAVRLLNPQLRKSARLIEIDAQGPHSGVGERPGLASRIDRRSSEVSNFAQTPPSEPASLRPLSGGNYAQVARSLEHASKDISLGGYRLGRRLMARKTVGFSTGEPVAGNGILNRRHLIGGALAAGVAGAA